MRVEVQWPSPAFTLTPSPRPFYIASTTVVWEEATALQTPYPRCTFTDHAPCWHLWCSEVGVWRVEVTRGGAGVALHEGSASLCLTRRNYSAYLDLRPFVSDFRCSLSANTPVHPLVKISSLKLGATLTLTGGSRTGGTVPGLYQGVAGAQASRRRS